MLLISPLLLPISLLRRISRARRLLLLLRLCLLRRRRRLVLLLLLLMLLLSMLLLLLLLLLLHRSDVNADAATHASIAAAAADGAASAAAAVLGPLLHAVALTRPLKGRPGQGPWCRDVSILLFGLEVAPHPSSLTARQVSETNPVPIEASWYVCAWHFASGLPLPFPNICCCCC